MTKDERGRWFRVYARQVRQHPKFRDLSTLEIGAWTVLRSEAELRDGAAFTDETEAVLMLRRRQCPRPRAMFESLVARRLFDVAPDGTVTVHDRADHDRPTYPSDSPDETRRRKAEERARKSQGHEEVTTRDKEGHDSPRARPQAGAGAASDSLSETGGSGGVMPEGWETDCIVTYHALTQRFPKDSVVEWLNELSVAHPEEAINRVMTEEWTKDQDIRTLLGRTETALKLDAHRREKADKKAQAEFQRRLTEEHERKVRESTPEERERAQFQQRAIRIGLRLGVAVPIDPAEVRKFVMAHEADAA